MLGFRVRIGELIESFVGTWVIGFAWSDLAQLLSNGVEKVFSLVPVTMSYNHAGRIAIAAGIVDQRGSNVFGLEV